MTSFPACVVCNDTFRYKGLQPNLLSCLHAVCSNCLEADVTGPLTCSVCQRTHDRSKKSFQVDQVVLAEVLHQTSEHDPSLISCTNKEDGNQAVCWCEECSDFLCEHCQISHAEVKISRSHRIWEISDLYKTFKASQTRCIKHEQVMNIFDKDCGHFICSQCFYTDHTKHNTITSEEFVRLEDQTLNQNLKTISDKKDMVCRSTAQVDAHAEIVDEMSLRLREAVGHTFSELRSLLDQRQKMILLELDQMIDCMKTSNNDRRPVLQSTGTSCQTTIDYINKCLQYTPPQHLLQLQGFIEEATRFCSNAEVPQVHEDESSIIFSKQGLQDIRSAISSFGSFFAPVGQSVPPDEFSSFKSAELFILERTIERLQKEIRETTKTVTTLKEELSSKRRDIETLKETNTRLQEVVRQIDPDGLEDGCCLQLMKTLSARSFYKCPTMTLDHNRLNLGRVHVDQKGCLAYGKQTKGNSKKHLNTYCGTSANSSLPYGLVYWEVNADVDWGSKLNANQLVLEVAVCDESVMDVAHYVGNQHKSCSLYLFQGDNVTCDELDMHVAENGNFVHTEKLKGQSRSDRSLKIGVLYEGGAHYQSVTFINVTDMKILGRACKLEGTKVLWPMFGVFPATKRMELISGPNIKMSSEKKMLLKEALQ